LEEGWGENWAVPDHEIDEGNISEGYACKRPNLNEYVKKWSRATGKKRAKIQRLRCGGGVRECVLCSQV